MLQYYYIIPMHLILISATRFVKCEKCNHFFVVIPDSETKKGVKENLGENDKIPKRKPPPPPKKVYQET